MMDCTQRLLPAALMLILAACSDLTSMPMPPIPTDAQIIVLGEVHDNPDHHLTQARFIDAIQPSAIVFEMLSPEQAALANTTASRGAQLRDTLRWQESGWPPWTLYQPVFEATGEIKMYGMALPKVQVRRAVSEGAAKVFTGQAKNFGLDNALSKAEQAAREELQQDAHCNMLPPSLLPGMVEAQRLRDASFAQTALAALAETGGPVVIITGTGHARKDWGIPAVVKKASPRAQVFSVGLLEQATKPHNDAASTLYDAALYAEPAEREDPCAAFTIGGASEVTPAGP